MTGSGRKNARYPVSVLAAGSIALLSIVSYDIKADPVYLDCALAAPNGTVRFKVKLDEESGKITHTRDNGSAFNTEGFFSASEVSYKYVDASGGLGLNYTQQWTINRVDMSVAYQSQLRVLGKYSSVETEESRKPTLLQGRCDIETPPKRQF